MLLVGQLKNYTLAYNTEADKCFVFKDGYKLIDTDTFYNIIMKYKDPDRQLIIKIEVPDFTQSEENCKIIKETMYPDYCSKEFVL